jgi:hypothetical protein
MIPPLCAVFTPWFHCICNRRFAAHERVIFHKRGFGHFCPLFTTYALFIKHIIHAGLVPNATNKPRMTSSTPGETTKSAFRRPAKGYSPLLLYIFWAPALHLLGSCSTSSGLLLYIFWAPALHLLQLPRCSTHGPG